MAVATQEQATKEAVRPALSSKARELMEQLNTDAAKSFDVGPHPDELAGAAPLVHRQRWRKRRRPDGERTGGGQPAQGGGHRWRWREYKTISIASPASPARPTSPRSSSRTGRASCSPIRASTAGCRSPTRSAARSRSTTRATSRPLTCTARMPAARSCLIKAATPTWKASAATRRAATSSSRPTAPGTTTAIPMPSR